MCPGVRSDRTGDRVTTPSAEGVESRRYLHRPADIADREVRLAASCGDQVLATPFHVLATVSAGGMYGSAPPA